MKNLIYVCGLLMCWGCQNDTPNHSSTPTTDSADTSQVIVKEPTVPDEFAETVSRKLLRVENIDATSTAAESKVEHLFDFQENTFWQTNKGSGPDEGILIEFKKDELNYVSSIELLGSKAGKLANVNLFLLYVNGQPKSLKTGKLNEKITIDTELKSLYIRIFNTDQDKTETVQKNNALVSLHQFPAEAAIALHSLNIYGKETEAYRVQLPRAVHGKVTASSTLQPEVAYSVNHLFDGKLNSAWVEGADDLGLGQTILFQFPEMVVIDELQVWNGYQRSPHHFQTNSSLKDFTFGLAETPKKYTLRNTPAGQRIKLSSKILSNQFELKILAAYQGDRYNDLAISEMVFYDDNQRAMVVKTDGAQVMQTTYQNKAKNTPLASILNRRIFNTFNYKYDKVVTERSLILHDDGTFVFYAKDMDTTNETIQETNTAADGNWMILESRPDRVKISIFGSLKTYNPLELNGTNKKPEDFISLFKDVLTIQQGQIEGMEIIEQLFW